jgi:phosphoserine phosphatase
MIELNGGLNPDLPDATFDLDGTVFKFTVLEEYTGWLCQQGVFAPLPTEITTAKQVWKANNTEQNYNLHVGQLVAFFIDQVQGKSVSLLAEAAKIVANQQKHRRWNITTAIARKLKPTHNIVSVSLMPEWLMKPFAEDLGFVGLIGSTYVELGGSYTGEAHGIDKALAYLDMRGGQSGRLDVHMGDTVGDSSLFALAKRPIRFSPSWTLYSQTDSQDMTVIASWKDAVAVLNPTGEPNRATATMWGPPFDASAILEEVLTRQRS